MASILESEIRSLMDAKGISRKSAIEWLKKELDNSMEPPVGLLDWEDAPEYTKKNKKAVKAKRKV